MVHPLLALLVSTSSYQHSGYVCNKSPHHAAASIAAAASSVHPFSYRSGSVHMSIKVQREDMETSGRSRAEVAVGLNTADWLREVDKTRSSAVTAVRVRHILVQTESLAAELRDQLRAGGDFGKLAEAVSGCAHTREKGGEVGWSATNDEHLDEIVPRDVRAAAMHMKPGDVAVLCSGLGQHVVQVVDVFQTLHIESAPRTRGLPGVGFKPRPLIELLRASREDKRGLRELASVTSGSSSSSGGSGSSSSSSSRRALDVLASSLDVDLYPRTSSSSSSGSGDEGPIGGGSTAAGAALAPRDVGGSLAGAPAPLRTLSYSMESMGCQMNSADAERMEGQLRALGFAKATDPADAHVVVINTCSIREHAEEKLYSHLGPTAIRKRNGEDVAIVVAGCVAQQEGEELLRRIPEIDMVMGPQYANRLGDLLEGVFNGNQIVATAPTHIMEDLTQPQRSSTVCAWVNVIYGCNERCTYCVVPTTRGAEQSRPRDAIKAEVQALVEQGYREVTLLGQNIDSWGRDLSPSQKFADLLREIGQTAGLSRLRFVTSHPRYMSPRVIDAVAETPALCEMFHIPFQSGDDDILKAMARGYTAAQYVRLVERIRERLPDAAITADAIVGFPGETEEQFQNTLRLMEAVKFDQLNTAAYSPRPHTPAALWEDQVEEKVKKERLQIINRLAAEHALERRQRYLGRVEEVLVEMRNPKHPAQVKGRNRQGCPVFFEGDIDELLGKLVPVRIVEALAYSLVGERVAERFAGGRYADNGEAAVIEA